MAKSDAQINSIFLNLAIKNRNADFYEKIPKILNPNIYNIQRNKLSIETRVRSSSHTYNDSPTLYYAGNSTTKHDNFQVSLIFFQIQKIKSKNLSKSHNLKRNLKVSTQTVEQSRKLSSKFKLYIFFSLDSCSF